MDERDTKNDQRVGYRDIKQRVLRRMREKTWIPGTLLPGEVELAKEFGCARATVNRAMRELADEGILSRKRKSGTAVCTFSSICVSNSS